MSEEPTRVMGPEINSIPHSNILTTPELIINADRIQWREEVRNWAKNVFTCANGGYSRAKCVATCIALVM